MSKPMMMCGTDGFSCKTYKEMEAHMKTVHSVEADPSTPSNNLKDEIAGIIEQSSPAERDWGIVAATQILNLILDTILAEIGEVPEDTDKYANELLGRWLERGRIKAVLEGLKIG